MANGHYRLADNIQLQQPPPPVSTEIYVNKDFIQNSDHWLPVNNFIHQAGVTTEMYNNSAPPYPPPGYDNSYQYQYGANYGYNYGYQNQQPAPPGDAYQQQTSGWTQAQPTYSPAQQQQPLQSAPKKDTKIEVVQEIQQQKATLTKQREDYVKKAMVLRSELVQLKQQKQELASTDTSEKELRSVLKENERLQDEINSKLKAILNVIEMLSTIIKDGRKVADLETEMEQQELLSKQEIRSLTPKPQIREGSRMRSRSPSNSRSEKDKVEKQENESDKKQRYCYVYYDTGLHWCRACDKFPETAKEFLQHLHSDQHQDKAKENEVDTTPWHKLPVEQLLPSYDDATKKRIPIKGLQFFISAPSWYCKLCDVWIGDLHCASHHLKSQAHFQNYENFVNQNPHWETEWLKDRERAMARNDKRESSESNDEDKKKKRRRQRLANESLLKEKKKKKRRSKKKKKESSDSSSSSSSSSDSSSDDDEDDKEDRGKSIRVAMRNMQQVKSIMEEDMSKWSVLEKLMEDVRKKEGDRRDMEKCRDPEDELINQWMTIAIPVPEKEKNLLESLKDRMRAKQDLEKAKMAELERRRREKEREEQEMYERKRRQAREDAERVEKERKRKEQEQNRVLDKDRSHVRFRAAREHFRKRRSSSDEENNDRGGHRDRSRHRESREREKSPEFRPRKTSEHSQKVSSPEPPTEQEEPVKKKPPGPPSYKKLPFIGRMPLFKRKMEKAAERDKEISTEEYEPSRKTRFETGNLTKAYIPQPDVVCFPMLSSIPPMSAPPEPTAVEQVALAVPPIQEVLPKYMKAPEPPEIRMERPLPAPPAPSFNDRMQHHNHVPFHGPHADTTYYQMYQTSRFDTTPHPPLEPPPLPPDDDLAMLGICADDMAAQSF